MSPCPNNIEHKSVVTDRDNKRVCKTCDGVPKYFEAVDGLTGILRPKGYYDHLAETDEQRVLPRPISKERLEEIIKN